MGEEVPVTNERYRSHVVSSLFSKRGDNEILHDGGVLVRVRSSATRPDRALLTIIGAHEIGRDLPPPPEIERWLLELARRGYRTVRTSALSPHIAAQLGAVGFRDVQSLELLSLNVSEAHCSRPPRDMRVRRWREFGHRGSAANPRRGDLVAIDVAAFGHDWAFDESDLEEALGATHRTAVFIAGRPSTEGFAVAGVSDDTGYLQRLAVLPSHQRLGIASALLSASVAWLRARGCTRVLVNTESTNDRALALYKKFGFRSLQHGLTVMERGLSTGRPDGAGVVGEGGRR